jgi:hypothetical protein
MPAFVSGPANFTDLEVGESLYLFNAETLTAPQASIAFSRAYSPSGMDAGITFQMFYAASPTAVLIIQGSNDGVNWINLYTSNNEQSDNYTDNTRWAFYRAYLSSQSGGGAVTVLAQR